ncbi:hypothetical protein EJ110_NYTH31420 [Nymphaea thermarum]|nr:hypothetical protein EJ110_NYTH31420 [Nymphaea thermarum]
MGTGKAKRLHSSRPSAPSAVSPPLPQWRAVKVASASSACLPQTSGTTRRSQKPQVRLNLGKRLDSRCRATRRRSLIEKDIRRSLIEEEVLVTQYNLRSAKGKGVAHSNEMGTSQGQEDLTEMVNKLVTDVTTHEEALDIRRSLIKEEVLATQYNLRSAKGKGVAHSNEMGTSQGQEGLTDMDEMKVLREQVADLVAMNRSLLDTVTAQKAEVKELQVKNRTLQRQISVGGGDDRPVRVDVQRPAKYKGTRDSREIDNFLFQVEYYLDLQGVVGDDLQIKTVSMLLEGDVVAWWRRKMLDIQKGICTIDTFDDFQRELRTYFMPPNATCHAYRMVGELKHIGSLRDYVRAYYRPMLDMPDMQEQDKLNWFILGLQSWAQSEVSEPQVRLNLGKRLDSRCRATRRRSLIEKDIRRSLIKEEVLATQYNLRSAKGKGVAHSNEMGTSQGQEDLTDMVKKLVTDVTTQEEALGNAAESFEEMKDEMKVLREQVADLVAMNQSLLDTVTAQKAEVKELQSWAQSEVLRSNPETLEDAYVVAERLADTQRKSYTNTFKPSNKPDHGGKKDDRRERKDEPSTQRQVERRAFFRKNDNSQNRVLKCWFCDGSHLGR